ncbi:AraC family transcriptional regulator [Aquimarina sp. U1-2]|uniref:AraC family transcriptional regulator n=1 Tax=Aquimarina sp. U1-2 TaxID=2823141 RepID=UPI001AED050A|nr:AraC family transcriptional regulator [Aquimarina sp. U1-2]MBP2831034.1 AraC family transcriptional regulator [Aquimarina sp. U1-2]
MTISSDNLTPLTLEEYVEELSPIVNQQQELKSFKKEFFIYKLEDFTLEENQFPFPFIADFFSVFFIEKGKMNKIVQLDAVELKNQEIFFSKPGEAKTWKLNNSCHGYFVGFTREYLLTLVDNKNILNSFDYLLPDVRKKFVLQRAEHELLRTVFKEMLWETRKPRKYSDDVIRLWLFVLLIKANRIYANGNGSNGLGTTKESSHFVYNSFLVSLEDNFTRLLKGEIDRPYNVAQFAESLNLNPSYLNECVKKTSGRTTKDLISRRLLLTAKCQLLHTGKTVSEIAFDLGFESPSYFARFFRKYEKMSPLDYRNMDPLA